MEETKNNSYFETAPIGGLIARFAIPSVISLVVNALYNIVDQIFIGNGVGYLGNGATSVVFPLTVIATALALLIGDGGATHLSLKLGAGANDRARLGVGNCIVLLAGAGIALLATSQLFLHPLLTLFGGTELIMPYALDYGRIIAVGFPFMICSTGFNSIIRADGNPKLSMISMVLGAVTNTVLDPLFIFVFHWGVKGAALATILGQIVSFVISVTYLPKLKTVRVDRASLKLNSSIVGSCLALGISSFITQLSIVIVSALCNNLMKKYGALSKYGAEIPMTVLGIVMKVNQILVSILIGVSSGAQPILGYNYGAGNMKRVKKTYGVMLTACLIISAIGCVIFQCFPQNIINLFGSESDLYNEFAVIAIRTFLLMCVMAAFQITSGNFLQAIGRPVLAMLSALLRQLIIFIPAVLILAPRMGVVGVLWAGPISDTVSAVLTLLMILTTMKMINEKGKGVCEPND